MATFMDPTRLRQLARFAGRPDFPPRPPTLVMRWMIEEETGRPVSYWVVSEPHSTAKNLAAE